MGIFDSIFGGKKLNKKNAIDSKELEDINGLKSLVGKPFTGIELREWNGTLISYVNGIKNGPYKECFVGNGWREGNYKNGQRDGEELSYYESGSLRGKRFWKDGVRDGEQETYFESGNYKERNNWKEGEPTGELLTYVEAPDGDGALLIESFNYETDIEKTYFENGQLRSEGKKVNVEVDGRMENVFEGVVKIYDQYGKILEEQSWKNGKQIDPDTLEIVQDDNDLGGEIKSPNIKEFVKHLEKHIDNEDVFILFHPKRWDVTEKMISDGIWNDKDYKVFANVWLKGVEMCYDNSLKELIKEIGSKKSIDEINAKEIEEHLYNSGDSGGDIDIEKVEWETPLTEEEEKELEEYGGGYQLYNDGDWECDEVVYETGNIYRIEVTVGDNKYTLERND